MPHAFAQFAAMDWPSILAHAKRLSEADHVSLSSDDGETRKGVEFDLRLYHSTIEADGGSRVALTVDTRECDRRLLRDVERHFSRYSRRSLLG